MQARDPARKITALYHAYALGLVKLAVVMTGDQSAAEDIVQDAFLGLHRRWSALRLDRLLAPSVSLATFRPRGHL